MAGHSRRQQKLLPSSAHKAFCPAPLSSLDGRQPPEQADTIFKWLRGCMALNPLRCYVNASSPEQRSSFRAIQPLNTSNVIPTCSGDCRPSIWRVRTRRNASCGALGVRGAFPPSAAMAMMVFCSLSEHEPLFLVELRHIGHRQKALDETS